MITGTFYRNYLRRPEVFSSAYLRIQKFYNKLICRKVLKKVTSTYAPCDVDIAESTVDRYLSFNLVYKEYFKRGLCRKNDEEMHYSSFAMLNTSFTLALKVGGKITGTATIIKDSQHGLPSESEFKNEVAAFRSPNKIISEISLLSIDQDNFEKSTYALKNESKLHVVMSLFTAIMKGCLIEQVTDLVIVVHPRHTPHYELLGFKNYSNAKSYRGACGKPGVLMHAEVNLIFQNALKLGLYNYINKALLSRVKRAVRASKDGMILPYPSQKMKVPGLHHKYQGNVIYSS